MKYIIGVLVIIGLGYFSKEAWTLLSSKKAERVQTQMEKDLFPLIIQSQSKEIINARPMRVEETSNTLVVYCEYLGDKSIESREKVRNQIHQTITTWFETQPKKYSYVFIKFTDEVISPFPGK